MGSAFPICYFREFPKKIGAICTQIMGGLCLVLVAVALRRQAIFVFEGCRKGFLIRKAASIHDVTDVFVREHQQFHGLVEPLFDNIAVDRAAGFLFEQPAQMRIGEMESRGQLIQRQILF